MQHPSRPVSPPPIHPPRLHRHLGVVDLPPPPPFPYTHTSIPQSPHLQASDPRIKSADAAYILAYSVLMLNTDLHNLQVSPGVLQKGVMGS
jgi:hypothetical protein